MSYDITIVDPDGEVREFNSPRFIPGGTYTVPGTRFAEVNVTYNYHPFFAGMWEGGIRSFHGMPAHQAAQFMEEAIETFGTEQDSDYWAATPGNAGAAIQTIVDVIRSCPQDSFVMVE